MITASIEGHKCELMIDTGAGLSTLTTLNEETKLTKDTAATVGFSKEIEQTLYTEPLIMKIGNQTLRHRFLYAPNCPVPLLGRDLMTKLNVQILCSQMDS